jgi:pyruvate/2-oxoglutarate dehydrogenase complex dihydrolipoamide dehydrogenase (E3) component
VTYTDPEVARVGLTEAEARERYGDVRVYGYEFADLDRAIVDGHTTGFVRVVPALASSSWPSSWR